MDKQISTESLREAEEPRGTFECPICGTPTPHYHGPSEQIPWHMQYRPIFEASIHKRIRRSDPSYYLFSVDAVQITGIAHRLAYQGEGARQPGDWAELRNGDYVCDWLQTLWEIFKDGVLANVDAHTAAYPQAAPVQQEPIDSSVERDGFYNWESCDGQQHNTGRVYFKKPQNRYGSFFASTASPEDAETIADALNAQLLGAPVQAAPAVPQEAADILHFIRLVALAADAPSLRFGDSAYKDRCFNYAEKAKQLLEKCQWLTTKSIFSATSATSCSEHTDTNGPTDSAPAEAMPARTHTTADATTAIKGEAARAAPAVPEARQIGREPTDAMQAAGAQAIRFDTTVLNKIWTANAVFRAMWDAAAPSPAVKHSLTTEAQAAPEVDAREELQKQNADLRQSLQHVISSAMSLEHAERIARLAIERNSGAAVDADTQRLDAMENMTPDQCFAIIEDAAKNRTLRAAIDAALSAQSVSLGKAGV